MKNKKPDLIIEITENENSKLTKDLESHANKEKKTNLSVSKTCQNKQEKPLL